MNQFFVANVLPGSPTSILQLYVTNGTPAGGTLVLTSGGTSSGSSPADLTESASLYYFLATDSSGNTEVWATFGSGVTKLDPNPNGSLDTYITAGYLTPFTEANGTSALAFVGTLNNAGAAKYQLYVTTGTAGAGTVAVGSPFMASPQNFTVSGSLVYFTVTDGTGGPEVWATNGTGATRLDPNPNGASDTYVAATLLTPFAGASGTSALVFVGTLNTASNAKYQLYVTTGTAVGTVAVGSAFTASPQNLTVSGSFVYFTVTDGSGGTEVWAASGAGATRLDPNPNNASDSYVAAAFLTPFSETNGTAALAFIGTLNTASAAKYQLYVTTGSPGSGTVAVGSAFTAPPQDLTVSGNLVYFTATDGSGGTEVWVTNGTGAVKLDPNQNSASDTYIAAAMLTPFTEANGTNALAFIGTLNTTSAAKYQLYVTTGTAGGGVVAVGPAFNALPQNITVSGNLVYFTATDSSGGTEVWVTNGTTATKLDPNPNSASDSYIAAASLTPFTEGNGTNAVAFVGTLNTASAAKYQLYVTTGTPGSGTVAVGSPFQADPNTPFFAGPGDLMASGNSVYFLAYDSTGNVEVWVTDGTGVTRLDPNPSSGSDSYTLNGIANPYLNPGSVFGLAPVAAAGGNSVPFEVTRAGSSLQPATLTYKVQGTGTNPAVAADFTGNALPLGTVTFLAGESSQTITIPVAGSTAANPLQTFSVTLAPGGGDVATQITTSSFVGTIQSSGTITSADVGVATIPGGYEYFVGSLNDLVTTAPNDGNVVFLGAGADTCVSGSADTIVAGAGADTVTAAANTTGSSVMFGGSGTLNFIGGPAVRRSSAVTAA